LEIVAVLAVLVLVWHIARTADLHTATASALAAGLISGYHAYAYDCVLLIPAIVSVLQGRYPDFLKLYALLMATPIPYLLLVRDEYMLVGKSLVVGFVIALLVVVLRKSTQQVPSPAPSV
jgi:hypothetical protein